MRTPRWLSCLRNRVHRTGTSDAGFTLLEALISFVIFAAVASSATYAIINALNASHLSQQRVDAADVAQAMVADAILKANTIAEIPPPGHTTTPNVGVEQFKVVETIVYDTGGSCTTGKMFTVNVLVYQKQTEKFLARSDARVACPHV